MDNNVTLDSAAYASGTHTYCYFYTLSDKLDANQIKKNIQQQGNHFRNELLLTLINSVELKPYKDAGINFMFKYNMQGSPRPVLVIRFTEKDYKKS